MTARHLWFTAPRQVEIRRIELAAPGKDEILVRAEQCGISAGTESLLWMGKFPKNLNLDESIDALKKPFSYPCRYGYCMIGRCDEYHSPVLVFHPHCDQAVVKKDAVFPLPSHWDSRMGALLPSAETALSLVLDLAPLMGESIVVFGLGLVGLISLSMLAEFPLEQLWAVDPRESRRKRAEGISGVKTVSPEDLPDMLLSGDIDGVLEISGNPKALQTAVNIVGYSGRIIVGSWYGEKDVHLNLGADFHRKRQSITSSQVSTVTPALQGRWNHSRRMAAAIRWLDGHGKLEWLTHQFPLERAAEAYKMIESDADYLQILLCPQE